MDLLVESVPKFWRERSRRLAMMKGMRGVRGTGAHRRLRNCRGMKGVNGNVYREEEKHL